jgi:hypothetical protein
MLLSELGTKVAADCCSAKVVRYCWRACRAATSWSRRILEVHPEPNWSDDQADHTGRNILTNFQTFSSASCFALMLFASISAEGGG